MKTYTMSQYLTEESLYEDMKREIIALRSALGIIALSSDDGDGFTSDGHERCVETALNALK